MNTVPPPVSTSSSMEDVASGQRMQRTPADFDQEKVAEITKECAG